MVQAYQHDVRASIKQQRQKCPAKEINTFFFFKKESFPLISHKINCRVLCFWSYQDKDNVGDNDQLGMRKGKLMKGTRSQAIAIGIQEESLPKCTLIPLFYQVCVIK